MFDFSVGSYAQSEDGARGAIFTRREVAEFILDLVGYTMVHPSPDSVLFLEPAYTVP